MSSTHRDPLQQRALRRVKLKMGFFIHATVFVLVNLGLAAIDLATGGQRWHLWPLAGWGLGLLIHGVVVFINLRSEGLHERLLQGEMTRLRDGR